MGERKVLNKYYSPDFDPVKVPRRRQPKNGQIKVRKMLPMSIRCNTCRNYISEGTKLNSRKEDAKGENYLGIQIFRFYFKYTSCSAELAIKTDPQNSDYTVESGARRNHEPWRNADEQMVKETQEREAEEMGDAMKSLENMGSKRKMDILATLEEVKSMKSRHAVVSVDAMLYALQKTDKEKAEKLEEEDKALIKSLFGKSKEITRRIDDKDDDISDRETSSKKIKREKLSEDTLSSAMDYLAKASDGSKSGDKAPVVEKQGNGKVIAKSPVIAIEVKKKEQKEEIKQEEVVKTCKNDVLQSLWDYASDESDYL